MKTEFRPYLKRLLITFLLSLVFVVIFTEGSHLIQRDDFDRSPQTFQIVIPAGTAERIAAGESGPSLPEGKIFVIGDVLEVVNQDNVNHQLGPIWVPAQTTGSLVLDNANKYSFSCSFTPSKYLGFDVREATTWATRITAFSISVPTTTAFVFIYSLVIYPLDAEGKRKRQAESM